MPHYSSKVPLLISLPQNCLSLNSTQRLRVWGSQVPNLFLKTRTLIRIRMESHAPLIRQVQPGCKLGSQRTGANAKPRAGSAVSHPPHLSEVSRRGLASQHLLEAPYCWIPKVRFSRRGVRQVILCLFCQPCPSRGLRHFELSCFAAGQAPRNTTHKEQQTNRHMARTTPPSIYASHTPFSNELGACTS